MPGLTPEQLQLAIQRYQGLPASEPLPSNVVDPWGSPEAPVAPQPLQETGAVELPPMTVTAPASPPAMSAPRTFDQGIQGIAQSTQRAADAVRNEAAVRAHSADAQAGVYERQGAELQARQDAFAAREEEYRKTNAETVSEFQRLNEQANNMRVVDRRSTNQKVMGVLGVALSGLGDAFAKMGGNNSTHYASEVQNQLNYVIERDLQTQREAIGDRRKAAASKLTELGLAREAFGDDMKAEDFATSQLQLKYAAQLKQVASSTSNEQLAASAEVAATQLEAQATQLQAKLIADRDEQKMRSRLAGGGAPAGQKPLTVSQQIALERLRLEQEREGRKPEVISQTKGARLSQDLMVRDPEIAQVSARDHEKLQKGIDTARGMLDKIDRIKQLRKENPAMMHMPYSDARAELEQIHGDLIIDAKNVAELGALSGPDMGLVERMLADPLSWTSAADAKFAQAEKTLREKVNGTVRARGFEAPFATPQVEAGRKAARDALEKRGSGDGSAPKKDAAYFDKYKRGGR